ncbi:bacteriocin-type signal sequence-containing protein [Prevotella aff. ruminicola Tc2-24]|jgi:bacteriocin-like protein|uniref:Bacteriocin-type signal sequence-containing protein n=1 Tax=Prevotella aff. ruminicola Tc2-24 TaxID=81582 RepID=A0A1I0NFH3_9BACT|nr:MULTISPECIES: bacteriocin [Prevotella]MBR5988367.1 bacteriocin [Prevotella sp.]SEE29670.1 bacteriocin-type signal sequence-containing protein [Prevotella sp. lc2012]SEV99923.1 bacteriocin-type signal sequence-containing protein [Prevotella aff. ruminicola Tc2-24]
MKNLSKSELNAIMGGPSRRTDADKCPNYSVNPENKNKKTLFPIISGILTK